MQTANAVKALDTDGTYDWPALLETVCGDVRRLDSVIRYNSIPVTYHENVSAHSFWVSLYASLIHRRLSLATAGFHAAYPAAYPALDLAILKYALVHDIGESLTGDVVRTFKYSSPELKSAIDDAEVSMMDRYFPEEIKHLIAEADAGIKDKHYGKYVKAVVKAADFMSLFHFMNREILRGNMEVRPFVARMVQDMKKMAAVSRAGDWYDNALSDLYDLMADNAGRESAAKGV